MFINERNLRLFVRELLVEESQENQGKNLITLKGKEGGLVGDFQLLGTVTGQPDRSTVAPNDFYIFLVPKQSTGGMPFSVQMSKEGPSLEDYFNGDMTKQGKANKMFNQGHPTVVKDRQGTLKIKNVEDGAISNFNLSILNSSSSKNLLCVLPKWSEAIDGIKKSKITDKTKTGFFGTSAKSLYSIFLDDKEYKAIGYYQDSDFKSNPTLEKFKTLVSITDEGRLSEMTHVAALLPKAMVDYKKGIRISPDEISVYNHDKDFKYDAGIINNQNTINDSIFKNLDLSQPKDLVVALVPMTADVKYNSKKTEKGGVSGADLLIEKLGFLGLIPGIGEVFDVGAGIVALTKDPPDKLLAALCFAAVIPVIGDLLKKSGLLRGVLSKSKSLDETLIEISKEVDDVEPVELLRDVDEAIATAKKNISNPALDNMPDVKKARQEIDKLESDIKSIDPVEFRRKFEERKKELEDVVGFGVKDPIELEKLTADADRIISRAKSAVDVLESPIIIKNIEKIMMDTDVDTATTKAILMTTKLLEDGKNKDLYKRAFERNGGDLIGRYAGPESIEGVSFTGTPRLDKVLSDETAFKEAIKDSAKNFSSRNKNYFERFESFNERLNFLEAKIAGYKREKRDTKYLERSITNLKSEIEKIEEKLIKDFLTTDVFRLSSYKQSMNVANSVKGDYFKALTRARYVAAKRASKQAYQDVSGEALKDWHAVHYVGAYVSDEEKRDFFTIGKDFLESHGKQNMANQELSAVGYHKGNEVLGDSLRMGARGRANIGVVLDGHMTGLYKHDVGSTTFSGQDLAGGGTLKDGGFEKLPFDTSLAEDPHYREFIRRSEEYLQNGGDPSELIEELGDSKALQFDIDKYKDEVKGKTGWQYNEVFIKNYEIKNIIAVWSDVIEKSLKQVKNNEDGERLIQSIIDIWNWSIKNNAPILDNNFRKIEKEKWAEMISNVAEQLKLTLPESGIISKLNESKFLLTKSQLNMLIRELSLKEYVVPMGYSLNQWKKKKKKEKISNKDYADQTKGDKWKVVHGKSKGKIGKPINKSAKNLSYAKATRMHTAIELNESLMKDVNNPERKQLLGKVLFTEYGYAIFQPFLAPILTSVFGPYIPPVDVPAHHRAETDVHVEERIEALPLSMPPELRKFSLFPEEDYEVEFVTKSNFDDIKLESFSVADIRKIIKEILSSI